MYAADAWLYIIQPSTYKYRDESESERSGADAEVGACEPQCNSVLAGRHGRRCEGASVVGGVGVKI